MTVDQLSADYELRETVRRKYGLFPYGKENVLPKLLGITDSNDGQGLQYAKVFNEDHRRVCEALLGPYGEIIYKMLVLKRG